MNPLDWSLIAWPLPVILLISALLALAWLAAWRNAPRHSFVRRGARGGSADGAASLRWLAICAPLIAMAADGVIALPTWLINNVWRPFPDSLPFTVVLWSWVALATTAFARVDPRAVLARTRFPRNSGVFMGGTNDRVYTSQQRIMYLAARHAGMNVTFLDLPGGHDWRIWRGGLEHNVAWLASQLGITGRAR